MRYFSEAAQGVWGVAPLPFLLTLRPVASRQERRAHPWLLVEVRSARVLLVLTWRQGDPYVSSHDPAATTRMD